MLDRNQDIRTYRGAQEVKRAIHVTTFLALMVSLISSCGRTLTTTEIDSAARLFNRGVGLIAEAMYADAARLLDSSLQIAPRQAEIAVALGVAYANQALDSLATASLKQATELDPGLRQAWYCLGFLYIRNGQNQKAIVALRRCKQDGGAAYLMGIAFARLDQSDSTIAHLQRSVVLSPQLVSANYSLAQALSRRGMTVEAEVAWERFAFLKAHGGTAIDIGGDLGKYTQGALAELPIPNWSVASKTTSPVDATEMVVGPVIAPKPDGDGRYVAARWIDLDQEAGPELIALTSVEWSIHKLSDDGWVEHQRGTGGLSVFNSLAVADWDDDGWQDMATGGGNRVTLWRNEDGMMTWVTTLTPPA
ncbi:MAG: hypothetical protein QGH20_04160, partial [Candidatus Latescibacteria bacterium]|nr:hypothetical protein [Candidatus Latescibacterota bacterium]